MDVDVEAFPWEQHADVLLDGPAGCWEVVGVASWNHDFGRWGATRGDAVFVGRLVDGVWGAIELVPLGEITRRGPEEGPELHVAEPRFAPMIGRVRGLQVMLDDDRELHVNRSTDAAIDPVSTVRDVLDGLSGAVQTSWPEVEDDGDVVFVRVGAAGARDSETVTRVTFPGGGPWATRWDLALEEPYVHSGWFPAKVTTLDLRLRGREEGGVVLPVAEAVTFELVIAWTRIEAKQTVRYTSVVPCAAAPPAAEAATTPAVTP